MNGPRLSRLEHQILDVLWARGPSSVREIQEGFPAAARPSYATIQTTTYRLEAKTAIRRVKKIGTALIFEAVLPQETARRRRIDELLSHFSGGFQPILSHLISSGHVTLRDIQQARRKFTQLRKDQNT